MTISAGDMLGAQAGGDVSIFSGDSTSLRSGEITLSTPDSVASGGIILETGT